MYIFSQWEAVTMHKRKQLFCGRCTLQYPPIARLSSVCKQRERQFFNLHYLQV